MGAAERSAKIKALHRLTIMFSYLINSVHPQYVRGCWCLIDAVCVVLVRNVAVYADELHV